MVQSKKKWMYMLSTQTLNLELEVVCGMVMVTQGTSHADFLTALTQITLVKLWLSSF